MKNIKIHFITYGTAKIMVSNISYETRLSPQEQIEQIEGVSAAAFDHTEDHFKNSSALFDVTFDGTVTDQISETALTQIEGLIADYDTYINTEVGLDSAADLKKEMQVIIVVAAIIIVVVLTLTSRSYAEVPVLIATFGVAAILNMGTNLGRSF